MVFESLKNWLNTAAEKSDQLNVKRMKDILKSESLSCNKCDGLSIPLYGSIDKYKCTKCGRQFSNSKHNIQTKIARSSSLTKKIYDKCANEMCR